MTLTNFQKTALGIAGATALAIGTLILFTPHAFYASYGIALGQDPNILSELRAPGAGLAALGAVMLAGLVRAPMAPASFVAAVCVYLAFPLGRIVSISIDGVPSVNVLGALTVEIVIAGLLIMAVGGNVANGQMSKPRK